MGQRLNIEIAHRGRVLANSYYHWSAYSGSSFKLVETCLSAYEKLLPLNPYPESPRGRLVLAIRMLEATGSGIDNGEYDRLLSDSQFANLEIQDSLGRSEGVLAVTREGIETNEAHAEASVVIDLFDKSIAYGVFWSNWDENEKQMYARASVDYPDISFYLYEIPFGSFYQLGEVINGRLGCIDPDGCICHWIS